MSSLAVVLWMFLDSTGEKREKLEVPQKIPRISYQKRCVGDYKEVQCPFFKEWTWEWILDTFPVELLPGKKRSDTWGGYGSAPYLKKRDFCCWLKNKVS